MEEDPLNFDEHRFADKPFIKTKRPVQWVKLLAVWSCVIPFVWPISGCAFAVTSVLRKGGPPITTLQTAIHYSVFALPTIGFACGIYAGVLVVWRPNHRVRQSEVLFPIFLGVLLNSLLLAVSTWFFL